MKSTQGYWAQIDKLKTALKSADAVVVGAGAGLSTSAGFVYSGERFKKHFSDFEDKYGFHDMYAGAFCRYDTPEEHWAYWSRFITVNRYVDTPKPVYENILRIIKDKDYFVITTNVDHCFQKAGFDKKRLFYTQGDYGLFQCSEPCCRETFENEDIVRQMMEKQKDMRIPSELIPVCPHCGKPMTMNLRSDNRFVEDEGWHKAAERYENFLRTRKNLQLVFLELGVGYNTPGIIKYPFWQMTANNPNAVYACVNYGDAGCPDEIKQRSICINEDIAKVLEDLTFSKLEKNMIDVIKEEQVKLGYRSETIRLYYPILSLNRLLDTDYEVKQMTDILSSFCDYAEDKLGRIEVSNQGERFCFTIPAQGAEYVHRHMGDNEFIVDLINAISKHGVTMDEVLQQFYKYSDAVHVEKVSHEEFDYLVYFENGKPDDFRYCITDEGCHIIYHRFTVDDYNDFYFEE